MSPLTKRQKRFLILDHLRPAFAAFSDKLVAQGLPADTSAAGFERWRRYHIGEACGKDGLRCCTQADFRPIIAYCWNLRGRPDLAFQILADDPDAEQKRQIRWKINRELEDAGLAPEYALAICRRQYGLSLDEASTRQLWNLFFTVKNRAHARKHRTPTQEPAHVHAAA